MVAQNTLSTCEGTEEEKKIVPTNCSQLKRKPMLACLKVFSSKAPSKLNILLVAYMHIEYITYQFSEKYKGGG